MSQEQKANLAQSSLTSTISDVAASLTVDSAASFPTSPQFRIILDDELMLVTAVAGAVFTVTRAIEGTTGVGHAGGTTVTLVETEAGQVRFQRDWSNPLWGVGKPMQLLDSTGATLTASSFTNVNFTNGTKTDQTGGGILLEHATQGAANDFAMLVKTAISAPWTLTVGIIPNLLNGTAAFPSIGPVVRENATGEFYAFRILASDDGLWVDVIKLPSPTTSSTAFLARRDWSGGSGVVWFQVEDNNTNLIFKISADGVNYITLGQEARTTFLTPDEYGIGVNNFGNGAMVCHGTIVAWDEQDDS